MPQPLANSITAALPELTAIRRDLHTHPELMFELPRTAGVVADKLRSYGFDEVIEGMARSGVIGVLHGRNGAASDKEGRVLLRADMDALPIDETTGAEYASGTANVMHACGHDGHTTMLLGAAQHLADTRAFDGTLVFCFQPAEEGGGGAKVMIDEGLLEQFPVKGAYAVHNWPDMPVGQFGVIKGGAMASSDAFVITVQGQGGHAAQPEFARDAIVCASAIVSAVQTIVARTVSPLDQAVVSITSINGGEAFNVLPDTVTMRCNLRSFSEEVHEKIVAELQRLCTSTAEAHGCTVSLARPEEITPYPPTVNHAAETELATSAMEAVVGVENVHTDLRPVMGSEDFAFFLREVPGAYVFIGNGSSAALHNPAYDFNDEAIGYGVAYWTELAQRALPVRL